MPGARTPSSLVTRTRIATTLPFRDRESGGHDAGQDAEDEDQRDEGERGTPRPALRAGMRLRRVGEDLGRERRVRARQTPVEVLEGAGGERQRRRLARG